MIHSLKPVSKTVIKDIQKSNFYETFDELYNKGNDCDCCNNQYLCGNYGDAVGCHCYDEDIDCHYVENKEI